MSGPPPAIDPQVLEDLTRALADELPELAGPRLRTAVARAAARVAEDYAGAEGWEELIDAQLARVADADDAEDRAAALLQLAAFLEQEVGDVDRALSARLGALAEAPDAVDGDELLRLAMETGRSAEVAAALSAAVRTAPGQADKLRALAATSADAGRLPQKIEALAALADVTIEEVGRAQLYREMAAGWEELGHAEQAAECHEWVLAFAPGDARALDALARIYRAGGRWPALIDVLGRRLDGSEPAARAALLRDLADVYERELGDRGGAIDALRLADELEPDRLDVVTSLARLLEQLSGHPERRPVLSPPKDGPESKDDEALAALQRLARLTDDPCARAAALERAAGIAWRRLGDGDRAQDLLARARDLDPDLLAAVDALAALQRERGQLAGAVELLIEAADRPALAAARARLLGDAAELCLALGDRDRATALFREARVADADDRRAADGLAELYWQADAWADLLPILDHLCAVTAEPARRRALLVRLGEAAAALGDRDTARDALARAIDLDPADPAARRALAELLFDQQAWAEARGLIERLLDDCEDALPDPICVALHYRAARCAHELDDAAGAADHAGMALALDPGHRPSLLLRAELDADDPTALVADHLALAHAAPFEEKAARFAALGDFYAERLGDPATAREMYREALGYRPTDHVLLTRCLGLVAGQGDWSHSLDLLQRLIDTELDLAVRARYRQVAAAICRDELGRRTDAIALLRAAIADDASLMTAADELEELLGADNDPGRLLRFYSLRLEQLAKVSAPSGLAGASPAVGQGSLEPRPGERLRLWHRLGQLCLRQGRRDDALCAFEVAVELDPEDLGRRHQLGELYAEAERFDRALEQHHAIVRASKRRVSSYEALRALYRRTGQPEKARACEEALAIIGVRAVADRVVPRTGAPIVFSDDVHHLDADDWQTLSRTEVDRLLTVAFALVAPALAAERARNRPAARVSERPLAGERDARVAAHVLRHLVPVLAIDRPPVFVDREQEAPCRLTIRGDGGRLAPALILGRPALDGHTAERELCFALGRTLADLRADRIARLLCPRADELGRILDAAAALPADAAAGAAASAAGHTGRWLAASLRPVDLDQLAIVGERLRSRALDHGRAALAWLEATERVGDRVGYLMAGDLATCVRALEREPASRSGKPERILDLIWSTCTEPVFAVRERLERWPTGRGILAGADPA
ncbi:MAG TPA: tetratricopeptide repeat protein [Kofleriaceae bacterium]|nr:tetratricopeptide repeat protein [Kofleriaceae bacterium]